MRPHPSPCRRLRATVRLLLAAGAVAGVARSNERLFTLPVPAPGIEGTSACAAGDVDHDGYADLAVTIEPDVAWISGRTGAVLRLVALSVTSDRPAELTNVGDLDHDGVPELLYGRMYDRIELHSGATGQLVWASYSNAFQYGTSAAAIGDVDFDGVGDLVVGTSELDVAGGVGVVHVYTGGPGRAEVVSGANGAVLATLVGPSGAGGFGGSVCALGDVDHDGVGDFAVAPWSRGLAMLVPYGATGSVHVYSGATRSELFALPAENRPQRVLGIGDADQDGVPDLVVATGFGVRLVSGATQAVLREWNPPAGISYYGESIAAVGDLDGDGVSELAIGSPTPPVAGFGLTIDGGPGFVEVVSPRTGATRFTLVGPFSMGCFGVTLCAPGDLDGDGVPDLVVHASLAGRLLAYSGSTTMERPQRYCVSTPVGGPVTRIDVVGSTRVSDDDVQFAVSNAIPNRVGQFFWSLNAGFEPLAPATTVGTWGCLDSPLFRAGRDVLPSAFGAAQSRLELHSGAAATRIAPGTTIYAQFVQRGVNSSLHVSDAIALTFGP